MKLKNKILIITLLTLCFNVSSREIGETQITAEEGIEVFQKEKYYLLKKNVSIESDDFNLEANIVKAFYEKDLHDISFIESKGNAKLKTNKGIEISGEKINLDIKKELIIVFGENSSIYNGNMQMLSNGSIKINNLKGDFFIIGKGSELKTNEVHISGEKIIGTYISVNGINEIKNLVAEDQSIANFKTEDIDMFAIKAVYNKKDNLIELFESVKVVRGEEVILGDHATINTLNKSYKVNSNKSKNVKILIKSNNE